MRHAKRRIVIVASVLEEKIYDRIFAEKVDDAVGTPPPSLILGDIDRHADLNALGTNTENDIDFHILSLRCNVGLCLL